ncbi:MAG TPA: right-handed parallel beta-helix repeat-containing protein [Polyangiaceae bacterium]|nr:right-handed parallel beta-helix repeat-containing protein [Polyangiaceae bacterium]
MQTSSLGVFLLAGSVSGCVVIEDRTPAPARGAVSQPLRAFVEQSSVTLRSVSAEVDGHLLPLALDPATGLYTGAYAPASLADRCKPSYSLRYQTVFQNSGGVEVTQYEPALGHYQREATGFIPRACLEPLPDQPLTITVVSSGDAELAPGATTCVSELASGECTLRAAVSLANRHLGPDVVVLGSGSIYILSIGTSAPSSYLQPHHLTIRDDVTIRASGSAPATILEFARYGKTLFDVNAASPVTLQLQGLIIRGFQSSGSEDHDGGVGGAITNTNGSLIIDACTFLRNTSRAIIRGGAIQNHGYLSIDHSTLTDNESMMGGAIAQLANAAGTRGLPYARIRNSTISNNRALVAGAGIYGEAGTLDIENVTFAGNGPRSSSVLDGGALCIAGATVLVRQSTFAQNTAAYGAGIYINGGTLALANSIVANFATSSERSSDVMGPVGTAAYGIGTNLFSRCSSTPPGSYYTCPFADSSLILTTSPGLLPLALNAPGLTETFALTTTSPARGQGPAAAANVADIATCLHTDQRGVARSLPCDLGAYQP